MQSENVNPQDTQPVNEALNVLREASSLLPMLVENLPGGAVFVVDRDLRYLLAQGDALTAAGFTPESFVGRTIFEVLPPELSTQYEVSYRRALAGEPFETEHNSHNHWYTTRGTPLRSPDGDVYAVLAVSFDITERKRDEDERKRRGANLAFLADIANDFSRLSTAEEIMQAVGAKVGAYLKISNCLFAEINEGQNQAIVEYSWHTPDTPDVTGVYRLSDFITEEFRQTARSENPVIIHDTQNDPRVDSDRYAALKIHAYVTVPFHRAGEWKYLFTVNDSVARQWQEDEIELIHEVTNRTFPRLERARAEQALRKSEAKYRSLFNSIDEGFHMIELLDDETGQVVDYRFLEGNPAFERLTGLKNTAGKLGSEIAPNLESYWLKAYDRVARTGEPLRIENYSEDTKRWYSAYVSCVSGVGSRQIAIVFNDITERKYAEAQLRYVAGIDAYRVKLSDALRSLVDPAQIQAQACCLLGEQLGVDRAYYVEVNEAEGYARVNQNYLRGDSPSIVGTYELEHFGWTVPLLRQGETIVVADTETTDIIPHSDRAAMAAIRMRAHISLPIVKADTLVGAVCVTECVPREWTAMDIELVSETAERIWADIQRTRAEAALRESEIQRIQEQSAREEERQRAEALAELDRAKTLFFSNISHEFRTPLTLLLAPLQDALGDRQVPLDPIHRERLELAHRNSLRLLKLVNTLLDFSRIEAGRIHATYEPTDLAQFTTDLASVFRSAIEQAGLRLIVDCPPLPEPVYVDRDMWEKIVLNLLSNAFKFTFAGEITVSLSVESSPKLQASASNTHPRTPAPQHRSSELQPSDSELELSTSEAQVSISKTQASTSEAQASISEAEASISEAQASSFDPETVSSEAETSGSKRETSPLRLEPSGSETQTSSSPTRVVLQIRDTGTGIAAKHLPHLFERFYQIRGVQARTHEGSGIGLALVHELVRLHGGAIAVSSTLGQGTCFTITLPFGTAHLPSERIQATRPLISTALSADSYVQEAEQWLVEKAEGRGQRAEAEQNRGLPASCLLPSSTRILLVDDNADMRQYLTRILSQHVHVEAVADGTAALIAIQTQCPDLILSDVMMPGLDGFSLLQTLRSDPRTREIPIILLSACAGEEAIAEGLEGGADDYLIKPFSAQELLSRVNAHLQVSHRHEEALHEARDTIRKKDELLSVVSHELNTPLVSILGWTRLLRASLPSPTMLSTALDTIERSATIQAKLVQDLLDVSRITAGKLRVHLQPLELEVVIEGAIAAVTQIAAEKGIRVTWAETAPAVVMGDRERLQQVVWNLLTNAIKFTPEGGRITVSVSVEEAERVGVGMRESAGVSSSTPPPLHRYTEIRVVDMGVGIAPDFLPHVFEPFRQAKGKDAIKGLGLGLAIASHIVELHNGTIQAQSAGPGQGAIFIVRLPLLKPNP